MPIRADLRHHYGREWQELSLRIRGQRAGWKCERCNAPHHETVVRVDGGQIYMLRDGRLFCAETGDFLREGSVNAYRAVYHHLADHGPFGSEPGQQRRGQPRRSLSAVPPRA